MKQNASALRTLGLVVGLAFVAAIASAQDRSSIARTPTPLERIAFYQQQIAGHPKHYPAYARLGRAWLDRARQTYDPADLAEARTALRRSLAIQPNYEAFQALAAAANYAHRFDESLDWCRQAAEAAPEDPQIVAMQVEALLALGRREEARGAIQGNDGPAFDFYTAAALGHWHLAQGHCEAAVARFLEASQLAKERHATSLAVWATVAAAGVWLDAGNLVLAKQLLDAASVLNPTDPFLNLHRAELAAAEDRLPDALQRYEELLLGQTDPELHRRAFVLAARLGRTTAAQEHLAAAEKLCRRAIDAGEALGLETLANLYCDAGRYAEAVRLAEQNLRYKRDAAALDTLARARQTSAHRNAGSPPTPP